MAYHQHIAAAVTVAIGVWMLRNFLRVSAMSTNTPPVPTIVKSEQEWKQILSPEQYHVLRDKGTERPGTGALLKNKETGVYKCAGCGTELYKSETKFDSGCGWPAFFDNIPDRVVRHEDNTLGMRRVEITCSACGGHLGHVFEGEGFDTPTDERHCVNSLSLRFEGGSKDD
eukprot:Rmarinus@m.437